MGAGKTTVGPYVSAALNWNFVDTDQWIEKHSGKSVSQIFESDGELAFREWERRAISELCRQVGSVVALGGGALMAEENRQNILKSGMLVYLRASVTSLLKRISTVDRPLLKSYRGPELEKHVSSLIQLREPHYRLASVTVNTDGKPPKEIGQEILSEVSQWKK